MTPVRGAYPATQHALAMKGIISRAWCRAQRIEWVWLLCERPVGGTTATKYYLSNLPPDALLAHVVRLPHTRWAIEQHYQDFKTELGLDHFEGRSYPGWHHHMGLKQKNLVESVQIKLTVTD